MWSYQMILEHLLILKALILILFLLRWEVKLNLRPLGNCLHRLLLILSPDTPSCIVLAATSAITFDLKPHVIQVLLSFRGLENGDPYSHVKTFLDICANSSFKTFLMSQCVWGCFHSHYMIELKLGWIPTCPDPLPLVKFCWANSTINSSQFTRSMISVRRSAVSAKKRMINFVIVGRDLKSW